MKNKVCECCFWTICMFCSQNNVLSMMEVMSVDNCRKKVVVVFNIHLSPCGHELKRFVECLFDLRLSTS